MSRCLASRASASVLVSPASQSIIADLFGKSERPRALGIFAIGTYLGVFLG
jgi:MFS family permease